MAKRGIDISAHQGDINLGALKSQLDFVIIRVGYGTKGTLDAKFKRNADLCRELGIPVGFYWYSYALDVNGAKQEAEAFSNAIAPYKDICKFGAWFDMEDADGYKKKNGMPSNSTLRAMCAEFCKIVEARGFYTGIYASLSWFNNQLKGDELNRFDKWVAQWPTSGGKQTALSTDPSKGSNYSLWQFTSAGQFSGYKGNLDTNYAYKDFPNPGSQSTPTSEPTPVKKSAEEIADEVIAGKWGNGDERKNRLTEAGYDYNTIQDIVNKKTAPAKKSIDEIAQEVIAGKWGNGEDRKNAIINAGYDYNAVQNKVNEILTPAKPRIVKGSKVKFTGTTSYSGLKLASWTHNAIFNVIEVSGDRVVIGKGTAVTSAVNAKDCELV